MSGSVRHACRNMPLLLAAAIVLLACGRGDQPLPGERFTLRPPTSADLALDPETRARPISLPRAISNAEWSHANGTASGRMGNVAFSTTPQLRWSVGIGEGDSKRNRILTAPVVAGGLTFVIDSASRLSAVNRSGQIVWSQSLVPAGQAPTSGPGGGLAYSNGVLFAGTGFGEVIALRPASGQMIWRKQFDAPVRAAPVVRDGRVIFVSRNDVAIAVNASNGEEIWRKESVGGTGLFGGASPAVEGSVAVIPFASGDLVAVTASSGNTIWATAITGGRIGLSRYQINDITGGPVISGSAVYASSQSGRTIRMDRSTGERLWTMSEGGYGSVWPVGGSIFLVSDLGELVRADTTQGDVIWTVQLPQFYPETGFFANLFGDPEPSDAVTHFGPVLAGGQLWVASGDGFLRAYSPVDGSLRSQLPLPGGAAGPPAVAQGVMYVVSRDGRLHAFQ